MRKNLVLVALAALVVATLVVPAAAAPKKCRPFVPVEPQTISSQRTEALESEVVIVTEEATEDAPVTIDYQHGPGLDDRGFPQPILEDQAYFNLQVVTKTRDAVLNVKAEWTVPVNDIDLTLFDSSDFEVMSSGAFNPAPVNSDDGLDGPGYETIAGLSVARCSGFIVESRATYSVGGPATMNFWLGQ